MEHEITAALTLIFLLLAFAFVDADPPHAREGILCKPKKEAHPWPTK